MIYIPYIQLKLFSPTESISSIYLRPASDSRQDVVPPSLLLRVEREILEKQWPWPYQTDFAT